MRYQFLLLYTLDPALLAAATEDVTAAIAVGALRVGEKAGLPLLITRWRRRRPRTTPLSRVRSARY